MSSTSPGTCGGRNSFFFFSPRNSFSLCSTLTSLAASCGRLHFLALARNFCPTRDQLQHQDLPVLFPAGTIYLWIFWPSFTSATTVHDNARNWAVLNTYFSLVASTVATFILSPVLYEESTPRMVGPLLRQTPHPAGIASLNIPRAKGEAC